MPTHRPIPDPVVLESLLVPHGAEVFQSECFPVRWYCPEENMCSRESQTGHGSRTISHRVRVKEEKKTESINLCQPELLTGDMATPPPPVHTLRVHQQPVLTVFVSSDNERIYSGEVVTNSESRLRATKGAHASLCNPKYT